MKSNNHIQYFPSDVLTKIFSFVDETDMCNNVPFVCEKWKLASSHSLLMKNAHFDGKCVSSKQICFILQNAPLLESVSVNSCNDTVPILRQISRCNSHIKTLILKDCSSNGDIIPEKVLINILWSLQDLQTIELNHTRFKSKMFFEIMATLPNITCIDLSLNEFISLNDLMKLVHNNDIKEFKLSRRFEQPKISDSEMSHLVRMMRQRLVLLHLDMRGIGSSTFEEILCCTKLADLRLNNAMNLTSTVLKELPCRLRKMKHLVIEGPIKEISKGDLHGSLFLNLDFGQQLETLKLVNSDSLNDDECRDIIESCPNLRAFSLKRCKYVSVGGIATALPKISKLNYLNIAFLNTSPDVINMQDLVELNILIIDEKSYSKSKLLLPNKEVKIIQLAGNK